MNGIAVRTGMLMNASSQRAVLIAFDHGGSGIHPGGEDAPRILEQLGASAAEGLLLGHGLARHASRYLAHGGAPRLVVALDAPVFSATPGREGPIRAHRRTLDARTALCLGATCGKVLLPICQDTDEEFADSLQLVARCTEEAHSVGLPVMVEPTLWGAATPRDPGTRDELTAHVARVAIEVGADLLKIQAPANAETLRSIVRHSPVPVLALGGAPVGKRELLDQLRGWLDCGVSGVVVGRNVWSRPRPERAVAALTALVHLGDVQKALCCLEEADDPTT